MSPQIGRPSNAFVAASWAALCIGSVVYLIGLWNAQMQLNEKGYYLTLLAYGLFSAISLQKSVRDRAEGIPVTGMYYNLCWFSVALVLLLLTIGLWNAKLADSEKRLLRDGVFAGAVRRRGGAKERARSGRHRRKRAHAAPP